MTHSEKKINPTRLSRGCFLDIEENKEREILVYRKRLYNILYSYNLYIVWFVSYCVRVNVLIRKSIGHKKCNIKDDVNSMYSYIFTSVIFKSLAPIKITLFRYKRRFLLRYKRTSLVLSDTWSHSLKWNPDVIIDSWITEQNV